MKDTADYIPDIPARWVKYCAKIGLTAKGVLYCLLGGLALKEALELNKSSQGVGRKSVFLFVEELMLGRVLLGLVAGGLACFCIWRLLQAFKDTESKGAGVKGLIYRLRYALSAAFYGLLALLAAKLTIGTKDSDNGFIQTFTKLVVHKPLGHLVLMGAAAAIALAGAYFIYQGFSGKYRKKIIASGVKKEAEKALITAGTIGYIARGIVWILIGYLLLQANKYAISGAANESKNVFEFIESASYGSYLLGSVAIGLILYGLFTFMEARFRVGRG